MEGYRAEARTAVAESLRHEHRVTIAGAVVEVLDGSLEYDEGRSPHVTLSLTVRAPEDQAILDSWDPRTFTRVEVSLGYRYADGTVDMPRVADLTITRRSVIRPDNTVTLTAESDEALVGEHGRTGSDLVIGQTYNPVGAIAALIADALPAASIRDEARRDSITENDRPLVLAVGDDPMRLVVDIADRGSDLWVYDDGLRTWSIRDRPELGTAEAFFTVGAQGTILASQTGLSRDDWGNALVLRHRWRDTDGTERVVVGYARVTSGPFAVDTVGRRLVVIDRGSPIDQGRADIAALSILTRVLSRGRSIDLDAIATYWIRPGDTVTITLPVGPQERHLVASARFDLTTGRMTLRTRQPADATITN